MRETAISLIALLILTLVLAGCGRTPEATPSVEPPLATTGTPRPTPEPTPTEIPIFTPTPTPEPSPTPQPTPTETPTLTPTPTPTPTVPIIEVEWETGGLNAKPSVDISRIIVDYSDPETIYVITDPEPNLLLVWRSTDGGNSWSFFGKQIWKAPGVYEGVAIPEGRNRPLGDKEQHEIFHFSLNPERNLKPVIEVPPGYRRVTGGVTLEDVKTGALFSLVADGIARVETPPFQDPDLRIILRPVFSLNRESWYELARPAALLKEAAVTPMAWDAFGFVSLEDSVRFYLGFSDGSVWQTTIAKENLP